MSCPESVLVARGKTKRVFALADQMGRFVSKDDITAGDGKKHDIIPGKGALTNRTTCNIFRLLKAAGIPVAFERQEDETSFIGPLCDMLPYEVVVRREAHGSYLQRYPYFRRGEKFPELLVEFFLKTKNRKWKDDALVCDDPLILFRHGYLDLYDPHRPMEGQRPFLTLAESQVFTQKGESYLLSQMPVIARRSFLLLDRAFGLLGYRYVDFKVEFGTWHGRLLLADTIDNDSGRLLNERGMYLDKEYYRRGGSPDKTGRLYNIVADITDQFVP
jgi:phosphoribosylaminoimidazole-succinocarboxamide synthase